VVAHLLKKQGHDLVGVMFTLWSDPLAPALANILPNKCCNAQTVARAKAVADTLDIPLHTISLEDEFKEKVVDPFLEDYGKGLTPNPCVNCNRSIKFSKLLEMTDELKCDKLATGHYARIAEEELPDGKKRFLLLEALDIMKDQSYYLYTLSQEQLTRTLLPLGTMRKQDIFGLAKEFEIPFDEVSYRESQDLCFFPEKNPNEFLKRYLKNILVPGKIVRKDDGTVVGTHEGLPLYTIGQRRLGIGGLQTLLEVVGKDAKTNQLIVAEKGETDLKTLKLRDINWISWRPEEDEAMPFECRTRSLAPRRKGSLSFQGTTGKFTFDEDAPLQASGQSLVLYRGEEIVGGGIIDS
jgi:tRNA-uridine 2-sulfurtransferase